MEFGHRHEHNGLWAVLILGGGIFVLQWCVVVFGGGSVIHFGGGGVMIKTRFL